MAQRPPRKTKKKKKQTLRAPRAGRSRLPHTRRNTRRSGQKSSAMPSPPVGNVERVLALDSSSRACGWSIFDSGQLVAFGHFPQVGKGHGERLYHYRLWLLEMFRTWAPHVVIYEAPFQGRMRNAYAVLSKYVAVIEAAHFEHFREELAETSVVAAHVVKKAIGAEKGRNHESNKKIVLLMVNEKFGLSLKFKANDVEKKSTQDDDADAIALNWAWHIRQRGYAR